MAIDKAFEDWFASKGIITHQNVYMKDFAFEAYCLGKEGRKKKKEGHPAFKACVEFWLKQFHPDWVAFNAGEGKAMNELIDKMEKYYLQRNEREANTEELVNFFIHLCSFLPAFYKSKSLKIINQNFDGIITEIRTKPQRTFTARASAHDIINAL